MTSVQLQRTARHIFPVRRTPEEAFPTSLQRLAECLRSLPRLFVADVGVADCRADILVAE